LAHLLPRKALLLLPLPLRLLLPQKLRHLHPLLDRLPRLLELPQMLLVLLIRFCQEPTVLCLV
jgi:hypothetical protein